MESLRKKYNCCCIRKVKSFTNWAGLEFSGIHQARVLEKNSCLQKCDLKKIPWKKMHQAKRIFFADVISEMTHLKVRMRK